MEISQEAINDITKTILNTSFESESEDLSIRLSVHRSITKSLIQSHEKLLEKEKFFINGFNIYNNKLQKSISMGTFMKNISETNQEGQEAFNSAFANFSVAQVKGIALAYQNAAGVFIKKESAFPTSNAVISRFLFGKEIKVNAKITNSEGNIILRIRPYFSLISLFAKAVITNKIE